MSYICILDTRPPSISSKEGQSVLKYSPYEKLYKAAKQQWKIKPVGSVACTHNLPYSHKAAITLCKHNSFVLLCLSPHLQRTYIPSSFSTILVLVSLVYWFIFLQFACVLQLKIPEFCLAQNIFPPHTLFSLLRVQNN